MMFYKALTRFQCTDYDSSIPMHLFLKSTYFCAMKLSTALNYVLRLHKEYWCFTKHWWSSGVPTMIPQYICTCSLHPLISIYLMKLSIALNYVLMSYKEHWCLKKNWQGSGVPTMNPQSICTYCIIYYKMAHDNNTHPFFTFCFRLNCLYHTLHL